MQPWTVFGFQMQSWVVGVRYNLGQGLVSDRYVIRVAGVRYSLGCLLSDTLLVFGVRHIIWVLGVGYIMWLFGVGYIMWVFGVRYVMWVFGARYGLGCLVSNTIWCVVSDI